MKSIYCRCKRLYSANQQGRIVVRKRANATDGVGALFQAWCASLCECELCFFILLWKLKYFMDEYNVCKRKGWSNMLLNYNSCCFEANFDMLLLCYLICMYTFCPSLFPTLDIMQRQNGQWQITSHCAFHLDVVNMSLIDLWKDLITMFSSSILFPQWAPGSKPFQTIWQRGGMVGKDGGGSCDWWLWWSG